MVFFLVLRSSNTCMDSCVRLLFSCGVLDTHLRLETYVRVTRITGASAPHGHLHMIGHVF